MLEATQKTAQVAAPRFIITIITGNLELKSVWKIFKMIVLIVLFTKMTGTTRTQFHKQIKKHYILTVINNEVASNCINLSYTVGS